MKRFPIGLTLATTIALTILLALGVWQLRRRDETAANQAKIAALAGAPARPLADLTAAGADPLALDHRRVSVSCAAPATPSPTMVRYSLRDGVVGWRLLTFCHTEGPGFDGVLLDRGEIAALTGDMAPRKLAIAEPGVVVGVLRKVGRPPLFGDEMSAGAGDVPAVRVIDKRTLADVARRSGVAAPLPLYLAVERETPAPAGVRPAPPAEDTPRDNFQYALTWFGLAAALAWIYGAMVWRRMRGA